jgi:transcription initiation factor TFIIE subunit alpha
MKYTQKILNETVVEVVGEDALPVVKYLKGKKNISEFKIAEDIKLDVNVIRNILYRMFEHNIVTYHRKKDRIKGWYISYWTLNVDRIKFLVHDLKRRKLAKLKEKLAKEESQEDMFFLCPNLCVRVDFDQATNFNFKCPECGAIFVQQDNTKTIENLKKRIKELEGELNELEKPRKKSK